MFTIKLNFLEVRYTVIFVLLPQNQSFVEKEREREAVAMQSLVTEMSKFSLH